MRIADLKRNRATSGSLSLKDRVLAYLKSHSEEVFSYRDSELARELGAKPSALGFTLWSLHEKGLIEKEAIDGKVYFGDPAAMQQLRSRDRNDWLARARANRERIFKRIGYVDNARLLEDVREGRWD